MKNLILISFIFLFFSSCKGFDENEPVNNHNSPASNTRNENLNISIFIDLSDRISPEKHPNKTMEYYQRDLGYIESITQSFMSHILHKKLILMDDRMQVFVDPPPANNSINNIIKQLKTAFTKNNVTKDKIDGLDEKYKKLSQRLYQLAIKDDNFVGSDIWGFFKDHVKDYCISKNHRNILIILTDGYIYHDDNLLVDGNKSSYLTPNRIKKLGLTKTNWKTTYKEKKCGFLVENSGLQNLEVLVLGINQDSKSPSFEREIIRRFWRDWLIAMDVKSSNIKLVSTDLPTNVEPIIKQFIGKTE